MRISSIALGGWLVQTISWRAVFFINVSLGELTVALLLWRVPESRDGEVSGGSTGGALSW